MKSKFNYLMSLLAVVVLVAITSCSDDDVPIDSAVGTFKGELTVYPPKSGGKVYPDATVTITKVDNDKLKVTPDPSTQGPAVTFSVFNEDGAIVNAEDDPTGVFIYYSDEKSIIISSQDASDIQTTSIRFRGYKQ